ncbi:MAG: LytR C-terminal domain-containing protein [Weeksellaceae bacterium]
MKKGIIALVIILLVSIGGFMYYRSTQSAETITETESDLTTTPDPTSEPTPEEVARDLYQIEVQNGSGLEGAAGTAQTLLEDADFNVESTANADNYDYTETVIRVKADVSESWIDELKEVLGEKYTVDSSVEELDEDAETDVVVIVGTLDENGDEPAAEEEAEPTTAPDEEEEDTTPTPSPTESA